MATVPVFSLRLRNARLRELVREVAAGLGISQNELIEQAVEHEVLARGAMLSEDLRSAAERISQLTAEQHRQILSRSVAAFAAGESYPDPIRTRRVERPAGLR